uniref:Protein YIF1 n=1 Tax=Meloidogyne hapla TaxID=6305 RepID=A0A1I8C060_MELHA
MTTPHYYDQNQNLNPPNPFDQQQQFDSQQPNFDYYAQHVDPRQRVDYTNVPDTSQQMFNQQFMYDPFVNTARHLGGQFAEQQKQKVVITQYISTFNLKYYFAVDVNYVRRKLLIILFPFLHRDWTNKLSTNDKPMTPREDVNAPDLYIPSMAFITYILVAGIVFGVQKRFTPEKLGMLTTNALFYMIFENVIVFLMKYALNISQSLNVWHALAYSSYKFTSSVTSYMPGKYDFAKMAMSGMGLSNSNKEVPLMSDGEVDYEALLKMP